MWGSQLEEDVATLRPPLRLLSLSSSIFSCRIRVAFLRLFLSIRTARQMKSDPQKPRIRRRQLARSGIPPIPKPIGLIAVAISLCISYGRSSLTSDVSLSFSLPTVVARLSRFKGNSLEECYLYNYKAVDGEHTRGARPATTPHEQCERLMVSDHRRRRCCCCCCCCFCSCCGCCGGAIFDARTAAVAAIATTVAAAAAATTTMAIRRPRFSK